MNTKQLKRRASQDAPYLAELARLAPQISITRTKDEDPNFRWDGDGPDPRKRGYLAYDVEVKATGIFKGRMEWGTAGLGGSYYRPWEPLGDIHGYLPQMIEEALTELRPYANEEPLVADQIDKALAYIKDWMRKDYDRQMGKANA